MIISKSNGMLKIGKHELPITEISIDISYAPFTEYGRRSESTNVIDSDAIVIDPDVLALPDPGQKECE